MVLPTLDASLLLDGSKADQTKFAQDLIESFNNYGFVKLRNHGISSQSIINIFDASRQFFDLPLEVKMSILHKGGASPARGYSPWGKEKTHKLKSSVDIPNAVDARVVLLTDSTSNDQEQLDMGSPTDLTFPTPWLPETTIPSLRPTLESFYEVLRSTCHALTTAIELGLHLPAGVLTARCRPDSSELRLNHYPSVPTARLAHDTATRRIWPHTDLGIFSVLFQDGVGGLALEDRRNSGQWLEVGSEEITDMVVNVSDTLEMWTNGVLRAGVHHVTAPPQTNAIVKDGDGDAESIAPERYSIVMFYRASGATSVASLPAFVSPERPAQFEDMTALEYLKAKNIGIYY